MVNGVWLAAHDASGQLIGCLATYEDNGAQQLTHVGRDTAQYAYFALMYDSLRLGLERGLHTFYWGTGAYSFKRRLMFGLLEDNSAAIAF